MSKRIATYAEFWPFYVQEHSSRICRRLHFVGTVFSWACVIPAVLWSPWYLLLMPVFGYGFAWTGHFVFQKNRPATFKYPVWSLISDFRMFWQMLLGKMDDEVVRYAGASRA